MTTKETNPKDAIGCKKAPMSCVPACVLAEIGVGMLDGAVKYGEFNHREAGVRSSVYYDATMRHLFSFWEGEDLDPDSGLSHITKAITSLVVLRDAMIQGKVTDDRPPKSAAFYPELNDRAAGIVERYSSAAPVEDNDGWIEWGGGECPVPARSLIQIRMRDGAESDARDALAWYWRHDEQCENDGDIIAYRVVK